MAVIGTGKEWRDIFEQTTSLPKQGFSINAIKAWRAKECDAGRPSSLEDFYKAHSICRDCRYVGVQITGYNEEDKEQLFSPCVTCCGTGRVTTS
jgi:hypothetical protein